jgi:NAD(P)-dependent dehydrogenase (short-subunit alcohol dehydrogenase family)
MSKTILITGAGRGIGAATARLAGKHGWNVGVNYFANSKAAEETMAAVRASGGSAVAIQGDVSREQDIIAVFEATESAFGPLDGFVNNAGIVASATTVADMSAERIEKLFANNVVGAFLCAREAARRLSKARGGRGGAIVNVSSIAARLGSPGEYVDYAATKAAIDTLTVGLAKELGGEGVRVNAVRPGLIATDIHASGGRPERLEQLAPTVPMGRAGTAEEVAEAIVWLLSDAASYVSGAILDIGGGR